MADKDNLLDELDQLTNKEVPSEQSGAQKEKAIAEEAEEDLNDTKEVTLREANRVRKSLADLAEKLVENVGKEGKQRTRLAKKINKLCIYWLIVVVTMTTASASHPKILIPDPVLLALVGSATLAIIGLLATVITYYFTNRDLTKEIFIRLIDRDNNK